MQATQAREVDPETSPSAPTTLPDVVACVVAAVLVMLIALRWRSYMWDFHMFYDSARDFRRGVSPYKGTGLSFYHPPITLYLYGLFGRLPYAIAYQVWLAIKCAGVAGLFLVWHRRFVNLRPSWPTVLYFVLGFKEALYSDIKAGNVSSFEQLGLWFAFAMLLEGRYGWFAICVALASQFKLTPIFFAGLLLVAPPRPQWKWFALCCATFAAVFSLNEILQPALLKQFFTVAPALDERGTGVLAFIRDGLELVRGPGAAAATHLDEAAYLLFALSVFVAGTAVVLLHRARTGTPDAKRIIYLTCVVYSLVAPRVRPYALIVLLIPTLELALALPRRKVVPVAVAAVLALAAFPTFASVLPTRALVPLVFTYVPLAAALAVFVGWLRLLAEAGAGPGTRSVSPARVLQDTLT